MSLPYAPQVRIGLAVAFVYMGMQTFAIPGTTSLSLVLGALFGRWQGFALVAATSTAGALAGCRSTKGAHGRLGGGKGAQVSNGCADGQWIIRCTGEQNGCRTETLVVT